MPKGLDSSIVRIRNEILEVDKKSRLDQALKIKRRVVETKLLLYCTWRNK